MTVVIGPFNDVPDAGDPIVSPWYKSISQYVTNLQNGTQSHTRVRITAANDAGLSSTAHGLQIGADNANNLIADNNEVQARLNGAATTLILNGGGGDVTIGSRLLVPWSALLTGKSTGDETTVGTESREDGRIYSTVNEAGMANIRLRRSGPANIPGGQFVRFSSAAIYCGAIVQVDSDSVSYNTSSDYRLKTELGPVPDPTERTKNLRPIRFEWKKQPGVQRDGFLAHEVAEVIPDAVTGEKDAVTTEGGIDPQGLDNARLVPLLVACIQDLIGRIEVLEGA